ncbi:hypothetical protein Rhopal_002522-T1 [Rhodotorula paludigena]|uniref:F-box domain-containing protein n=1 Tax=Rhodotorula paludigena TaxID=86838 RepID=A0AAV5GJ75_9BASI|nr:hypothetical protein Rhopal_002522-T1 [Rhodotorula paludigena]
MLDRLPPELLLRILDLDNFRSSSSPWSTREDSERPHVDALRACTLVCKNTCSVARPELWREVSTFKSIPQYERLLRLCAFPRFASLAQLVRVLGYEPKLARLDRVLMRCDNQYLTQKLVVRKLMQQVDPAFVPSDWSYPHCTSAWRDLNFICLNAHGDPSAPLTPPVSDAYPPPRIETIFLPKGLRDPPASAPRQLVQQRSQIFEQCAEQHVRVEYLCSELRPDWPEWAKGLLVLEELVDRESRAHGAEREELAGWSGACSAQWTTAGQVSCGNALGGSGGQVSVGE